MNSAATRTSPKLYNCLLSWNPLAWSKKIFPLQHHPCPKPWEFCPFLGGLPFFWGMPSFPYPSPYPHHSFFSFCQFEAAFPFHSFRKTTWGSGDSKKWLSQEIWSKILNYEFYNWWKASLMKKNNWITQRKTSSVKEKLNQGKKLKYSRNSSTEEQFSQGILHSRNSSVNVKSIREQCGQGILQSKNNSVRHTSVNKI